MMQIDSLVLYNSLGDVREIKFNPGSLNIITGESGTGKSSLISILRFLLGGDSPNVPIGPIQESVEWYGLLAHVGGTSFFVGRPAPDHGATTTKACIFPVQTSIPPVAALRINANADDIVDYVGSLIGICENQHVPPVPNTRKPLSANLRHALYYCFQGQGEIANPDLLFHHQNLDYQKQAIRDTLPYFLGAQDPDVLRKRQELSEVRRKLRMQESRLEEAQAARNFGIERTAGLIEDAKASGLLSKEICPKNIDQAIEVLTHLRDSEKSFASVDDVDNDSEFESLVAKRSRLRVKLRSLNENIRSLDEFARVGNDYSSELDEHRVRLASIGLIPSERAIAKCPICDTELSSLSARSVITQSLERVSRSMESARREIPHIDDVREKLVKVRGDTRAEIARVSAALEHLSKTDEASEAMQASLERQSFVRGRIAQYLETVSVTDDDAFKRLEQEVCALKQHIIHLSAELDPDGLRSTVQSLLNVVGHRMTELARSFPLEHSEFGVRIDPYRLTVVADTPRGPAYMDAGAIGSGMSWVGYHLTAYLALQEYYINAARPVPRFVFFDQPSQAFYPSDRGAVGGEHNLSDVDRINTLKLFRMMFDVVSSLKGELQIIAVDHADFQDPWFQSSVIEVWRDGKALIPSDWK